MIQILCDKCKKVINEKDLRFFIKFNAKRDVDWKKEEFEFCEDCYREIVNKMKEFLGKK